MKRILLLNGLLSVILFYHLHFHVSGTVSEGFFLILSLFGPGLICASVIRSIRFMSVDCIFYGFVGSLLINGLAGLGIIIVNVPRDHYSFLSFLLFSANLLVIICNYYASHRQFGVNRAIRSFTLRELSLYCLVFVLTLIVLILMVFTVPILYDNETFHIGSAYGLIDTFAPRMWPSVPDKTFREINYSRPPLTHFFSAWSILLSGNIDETSPFYFALSHPIAERPYPRKAFINGELTQFPNEIIANARGGNGKGVRVRVEPAIPVSQNLLHVSRYPQVFALFLSLIPFISYFRQNDVSAKWIVLGWFLFISMPEVLIRGISASTEPMTYFFIALLIYFFDRFEDCGGGQRELFLTSFLLFWVNQKAVVFIVAIVLYHISRGKSISFILRYPAVSGFVSGFLFYSFYGILLDPLDFFNAFLGEQGIFRFLIFSVPPPEDRIYPDVLNLWCQFDTYLGSPFLFIVALLFIYPGTTLQSKKSVFLFCVLVTAFSGSLVDRRMTRHLVVCIQALLYFFVFVSSSKKRTCGMRMFLSGFTLFLIIRNVWLNWMILSAFSDVGPLPAW